jgi:hypothetical protein
MLHIFCVDDLQKEAMEISINNHKKLFKEKIICITDLQYLNMMINAVREQCKSLHYVTKEITYYCMGIIHLSDCLSSIVMKKEDWKEKLNIAFQMNFLGISTNFNVDLIDIDKPEQIIRVVSAQLIKNVKGVRTLLDSESKVFDCFAEDTINVSCKLVEKHISPLILQAFELGLTNAIISKKPKKFIKEIEDEIKNLKISSKTIKESTEEINELFISNIRIFLVYIYTIFIIKIMKIYGMDKTYLITISSVDYSILVGLLWEEFKNKKLKIQTHVFGDLSVKEIDEKLNSAMENSKTQEKIQSDKAYQELLELEEEEKRRKLEKEEKKLLKEKLVKERLAREEQERLAREEQERLALEEEKQRQDRKIKQEQERLAREEEKQKQERLAREEEKQRQDRKIKEEQERLAREEEKQKQDRKIKEELEALAKKKLNPYVQEFVPKSSLVTKVENIGVHITKEDYDKMQYELSMFKSSPNFYVQNPNIYLFQMIEHYPQVFKINELKAFSIAKTISKLWNYNLNCKNTCIRDTIYNQIKLTESLFYQQFL